MGNAGAKKKSEVDASVAASPHFPCRVCGKYVWQPNSGRTCEQVLQEVLDLHEETCRSSRRSRPPPRDVRAAATTGGPHASVISGAGGGAGAGGGLHHTPAEVSPSIVDADLLRAGGVAGRSTRARGSSGPTCGGVEGGGGDSLPDRVKCWSCDRSVLTSVIAEHIETCLDRRAALALHTQLNGQDTPPGATMIVPAPAPTPTRGSALGGLKPGRIGSNASLALVPAGSDERRRVEAAFAATCDSSIVAVWRVTNEHLRARYELLRKQLAAVNAEHGRVARDANERYMFHGTKFTTVPQICEQGFNRSYCGQNGVAFGRGVYFARNASYSASTSYSPKHKGVQHMLYCRVLVGEPTQGNSSMVAPPPRSRGSYVLYDSTCNGVRADPSVVVVFQDAQALPEYVIAFK